MSFNNFTGLNIVPTNEWTMDLKGAKQIKMVGLAKFYNFLKTLDCIPV
jgi:hypothetical protein